MAGNMGDKLRTMQIIEIIKSDLENDLIYLKDKNDELNRGVFLKKIS